MSQDWRTERNKIIGLGDNSFKKSYYPELQRKLKELEIAKENFKTVFDASNDGIIIHDCLGEIIILNQSAQKFIDISDNVNLIFEGGCEQTFHNLCHRVIGGESQTFEAVLKTQKGSLPVEVSVNTTVWDGRKVLASTYRDLSERKKYEEELIHAKNKAEEADRLKSEFLASMSHEIRTPMNAIVGFTGVIAEQNKLDELKGFSGIVQEQAFCLLTLLDDIIEFSKIEAGSLDLFPVEFDMDDVIRSVQAKFKYKVKEGVEFVVERNVKPSVITADKQRVEQVFTKLVSNAVKFTNEGRIVIGFFKVDTKYMCCYVKDTGIGIAPDYHSHVFERFSKENTFSQGTGIGLAIVKRVVDALDGTVWFDSQVNKGTNFYFKFPV